jgi:hypothetical protein
MSGVLHILGADAKNASTQAVRGKSHIAGDGELPSPVRIFAQNVPLWNRN